MTVYNLLRRLGEIDARVIADGDVLRLDAPEGAITVALREEIVRLKPRLLEMLRGPRVPPEPLVRVQRHEAETSFAQRRLWFVTQLLPESAMYNVPAALRIRGVVDADALAAALTEIVRRHESLRTTFRDEGARTMQVIGAPLAVTLPVDDLRALPETERESCSREIGVAEAERIFDLRHDLMIRARLVRLADDESLLLLTLHHIASDGWSLQVLFDELSALYEGKALPALPFQYADFSEWQRKLPASEDSLEFWRKQLVGLEVLELPSDRPRPAQMSYRGSRESVTLDGPLGRGLHELGRDEGATLFMTLLAAYAVLVHRYTGRTDIAIGSPVAGRERAEVENVIGFFVNSVVMRIQTDGDTPFRHLLGDVRRICLDAWAHQDVPFEHLVEVLQPQRDARYNPLFQTLFALRHETSGGVGLGSLAARVEDVDVRTAKFDLGMEVEDRDGVLTVHLSYSSDLFEADTARRMLGHYTTLLAAIVQDRDLAITHLDLLSGEERDVVVADFNDTTLDYERDATIAALFEAQVRRTPDAIAARSLRDESAITYAELDARANRVAHALIDRGAGPEVTVAVQMERSIDMLVALLAVTKAGAAYVPIDPSLPEERRRLIARDARTAFLLVDIASLDSGRQESPERRGFAQNLAYVTYTSGSTGRPKGVAVPHRAVARLARNNDFAPVGPGDAVLQYAPLAFDASTFEVWATLLNGATLLVMPPQASLEELGAAIRRHGVTALWLTAGLFHLMVEQRLQDFAGVRQLLAGGDVLSPSHVERVLRAHPSLTIINGYGPTENTTFTCCHRMAAGASLAGGVPIGRPIRNTRVYILDRHLQPLPAGVPGELYAAGDGLARGYFGDAALSAEKFVPNPFAEGERFYRTGDLARWRADGAIEFLGRIDHQVKIRGYRIELGEIESVLRGIEGVEDAVVVAREETPGDKRLIAYVAAKQAADRELRTALRQLLPDYMVPATIVVLDALPLNANGKVDRAKLPVPERARASVIAPASSESERIVAEVWKELLGTSENDVHDNFFDVGGHSLLLLQMRTRLVERSGKDIPLMEMFRKPTIRAMAGFFDAKTVPMAAHGVVDDHNQRAQMRHISSSKRKQQHLQERRNRT